MKPLRKNFLFSLFFISSSLFSPLMLGNDDPRTNLDANKPKNSFPFADFTWSKSKSRQKISFLDSSETGRTKQIQAQPLGSGGDFHYDNMREKPLSQVGMYSTKTPQNDGLSDLANANSYMKLIGFILAALVLVMLNAVWVAAEFAIVRARRTRLEELVNQGGESAKDGIIVVDSISDYLALTQLGITVASLAAGWLAEGVVVQVVHILSPESERMGIGIHSVAMVIAFLLVTLLHVLLGEQIPKVLAVRSPEKYLLYLARPLRLCHFIAKPFLRILSNSTAWVLRLLGHGCSNHEPLSEEELKLILEDSHKGGVVTAGEAEIIVKAFEFADKDAEEVMLPAERVSFISLERTLDQNLEVAIKHLHARLPLCRSDINSVMGIVSMKNVWPLLENDRSNGAFERCCQKPTFIPVETSQEQILKLLREAHAQMGIVRNRSDSKTLGIVTLEDVLESLVGDIREKIQTVPR